MYELDQQVGREREGDHIPTYIGSFTLNTQYVLMYIHNMNKYK